MFVLKISSSLTFKQETFREFKHDQSCFQIKQFSYVTIEKGPFSLCFMFPLKAVLYQTTQCENTAAVL